MVSGKWGRSKGADTLVCARMCSARKWTWHEHDGWNHDNSGEVGGGVQPFTTKNGEMYFQGEVDKSCDTFCLP